MAEESVTKRTIAQELGALDCRGGSEELMTADERLVRAKLALGEHAHTGLDLDQNIGELVELVRRADETCIGCKRKVSLISRDTFRCGDCRSVLCVNCIRTHFADEDNRLRDKLHDYERAMDDVDEETRQ